MERIESLTGMIDLIDDDKDSFIGGQLFQLEKVLKNIFKSYGFKEIRTPALEYEKLFRRSVGDASDIVNKELYSFVDKGNRNIVLRPEGTAGVIRFITQKKMESEQEKFWYMGPMWRYERPQKGRYRQFHQAGIEILGHAEGLPEYEVISLVCSIIKSLQIPDTKLIINHLGDNNSKKIFAEELYKYFKKYEDQLEKTDLDRLNNNPIRILDSKCENVKRLLTNAPSLKSYISDNNIKLLEDIKSLFSKYCDIEIDYNLVRGLDYYNGFVFEAISKNLGSQSSFLGGGRYDNLSAKLGGKKMLSVGMALGLERLASITELKKSQRRNIAFIVLGKKQVREGYQIAQKLIDARDDIDLNVHLSSKSLKAHLRKANKDNSEYAFIFGEDEQDKQEITVKPLQNELDSQTSVKISILDTFYKEL